MCFPDRVAVDGRPRIVCFVNLARDKRERDGSNWSTSTRSEKGVALNFFFYSNNG